MKMKRTVLMAVLAVAVAALTVPLLVRTSAAGRTSPVAPVAKASAPAATPAAASPAKSPSQKSSQQIVFDQGGPVSVEGQLPPDVINAFFPRLPKGLSAQEVGRRIGAKLRGNRSQARLSPQVGQPEVLNATSALSAALIVTIGGRDTQFSEVALLADWDGREDCVADHAAKVDDFSGVETDIDQSLTRAAISEHTFANGFNENIFYYGDSVGNVWVGADTTGDGQVDSVEQINLPTVLNAFGTLVSDDQVTITGLAVNPVADLSSFANVNGAYTPNFAGVTGEILYVTFADTQGLRLTTGNQLVRSGVLAFPVSDAVSPAAAPPGVISNAGFPVTIGGAFGVAFSVFVNNAGCAVDDDGSVYFQQVDLINFTGGNIVKIRSLDTATNQDRSLAVSGILTITTLNPAGGVYGTTSGPVNQINRFTNYSGTSTTWGNIMTIGTGNCNTLYAALAKSNTGTSDVTEGRFANPSALGATPSMVISLADCAGAFDVCSGLATSPTGNTINVGGQIPAANDFADVAGAGLTLAAGVNNFRVFVLGTGPAISASVPAAVVTPNTLKVDFQVDFTAHNGIAIDENGTVYVISGGTPAGIGVNPSPLFTEILCFEDQCPMDRRADFVDYRGNAFPIPPASGGTVGDGDSDRFDHIFDQAPIDQVTLTPTGMAGLARGFLRYTNRLAPGAIGTGVTLGVTDRVQGDDDTDGTIAFEALDPGHQVAGGDDQNPPFRGDDDNGAGTLSLVGPLSGGFEFVFGGPVGVANCTWNGFFLNSNGNITFGVGDTSNVPDVPSFRAGPAKIAPAWADLNPSARAVNLGTFPLQALGFAGINTFRVRWINVPQFGSEACAGSQAGSTNTFGITLFDDGTGIDENANQALNPANPIGNNAVPFDLQEGPTDLRFTREPNTGVLVGCVPRREGTGHFRFDYCRMDILGTPGRPALVGYSIGNLSELAPPGLCEINLSEAARAADAGTFGVIQGQTAVICPCLIGEGTEPTQFEFFNEGADANIGSGGETTLASVDFDLRFEGNDAALCTASRQRDLNRDKVGFYGIGCAPPPNPNCAPISTPVIPGPFNVAPNQPTRLIDALCDVQLNVLGCGFFPNETTIICQGFSSQTGVPLQRPGKTVTTAMTLTCDTNGDAIADATIVLANVTPVSKQLVRGTLASLTSAGLPGTAFPLSCCGGPATVTVTTTFSAGDNNVFGPFTRSVSCPIDLGLRAPVVISIAPSDGNCAVGQNTIITGACFVFSTPGGVVNNVTRVFAVERLASGALNPANTKDATRFVVLGPTLIDAFFEFGTVNAGKTFMIFVSGPNGTSRNLLASDTRPAGCPTGNEQGIQVTFTCLSVPPAPCVPNDPRPECPTSKPPPARVDACDLGRNSDGSFTLTVLGSNIKSTATVTVGGKTPKKVKFQQQQTNGTFNRLKLKGGICSGLPGAIVIRNNDGSDPSAAFQCNENCPSQQ